MRTVAPAYRPQLARLVKEAPEGDEWLHEMKYDGYRIGCRIRGTAVTLTSRTGKDWTEAFPEITAGARQLAVRDALLDGEIALVLPDGRTSFQALQNAFSGGPRRGLTYFVFDVLRLGREDLASRPLEERKAALLRLLGRPSGAAVLRYSEHVVGRGAAVFQEACRLGLEGIISKRGDAAYQGGRGDTWLKTKCIRRQEFVIGGFTDPEGSRQGIGALLVGHYEQGALRFAGKVGTGFTVKSAQDLRQRLEAIAQREPPFTPPPAGWLRTHAHWTRPALVAEVAFTEWTDEGKIRHPSFQGLRRDKRAADVVREIPAELPARVPRRLGSGRAIPPARKRPSPRGSASPAPEVCSVRISHPDRVLYPEPRLTKLELAQFYGRMARWMLPHVQGRPLTLVRCPDGIAGDCFYMKHSKVWAPDALRRVTIQEKTKLGEYLIADTAAALVSLVQMGVLEVHTWNTRIERVECPDRMVFDIDPGARVGWPAIAGAARTIRRLLAAAGLESFPKTTGGKGLHVVVPLAPVAGWQDCLAFARGLAEALERQAPELYTTAFAKAGREEKILIDYLRNNRTNTSVAAFSTRARPGAPVSVPLRWSEVTAAADPRSWTVATVEARLSRLRTDPWSGYWKTRQRLPRSSARPKELR